MDSTEEDSNMKKTTPLPKATVAVLFFVMYFTELVMTSSFSYLPKLIQEFGISNVNVGYYAGILVSCMYIGRTVMSFVTGYMTDSIGHRATLMILCTGITISTFFFAFTNSYEWAIVCRTIQGTWLCAYITVKGVLSYTCDETNASDAITWMSASKTLAMVTGQTLGAFTSFPAEQYPSVFPKDSIFGHYKILIPNMVIALGMLMTTISIWNIIYSKTKQREILEKKNVLLQQEKDSRSDESLIIRYIKLLKNRTYRMMMLIAFLNVVVLIVMLEVIPLFLATEKQYGGLAYDQKHIGTVLLIAAIPILPIELTLILKIVKVNGPRNGLIWSSVGQMIFIPLLPLIHHIQNATVQYVMVILYIFIMNGIIFSLFYISFSSALLNIVKPTEMGILSGIGMCNASLARIFGPAIFGPLYSWSLKNKEYRDPKDGMVHFTSLGFPLDIYFVFISLSFLSFCTILLIKFMLKIK